MDMLKLFVGIPIAIITFGIYCRNKCLKIPGPRGWPLLGNLHQLNKAKLHVQLLEWAKQFGPVYYIRLGLKPIVIVTGSKQTHEVLVKKGNEFSGRSTSFVMNRGSDGKIFAGNEMNKQMRIQKKIFMSSVKAYGSGLKKIEEITAHYTNQWIDKIRNTHDDCGIDMRDHLEDLTFNIINTIIVRDAFHNDDTTKRIKNMVKDMKSIIFRFMTIEGFILDTFPFLRFIFPSLVRDMDKLKYERKILFMELKSRESALIDKDGHDIEDTLLSKLVQYEVEDNEDRLSDENICEILFSAYVAGIVTTRSSLSFLFSILSDHKDIQEKIQSEIDSVIQNECVHIEDRWKMPYTQATLLETLRYTSIAPTLFPHRSTVETSIDGHHIPKNTEVWINGWGLHHDDSVWDQPFSFMPERFLDESGAVVPADHPNRRSLVAFGAGPRVCAGENFAMSRMFLILTMFLQKFSVLPFSADGGKPMYDTRELNLGLVLEPPQHKVKLIVRN